MSCFVQVHSKFFRSTVKVSALLLPALLFNYSNALAKTITVTCPSVKTVLTSGYTVTPSKENYQWSSWQSQPRLEVSTADDKSYFAEINQSAKGLELRCVGGSEKIRYGFYTHIPKVISCKIDSSTNTAFICQVND